MSRPNRSPRCEFHMNIARLVEVRIDDVDPICTDIGSYLGGGGIGIDLVFGTREGTSALASLTPFRRCARTGQGRYRRNSNSISSRISHLQFSPLNPLPRIC